MPKVFVGYRETETGLEFAHVMYGGARDIYRCIPTRKFKPTGIRVDGTRLYELMIHNVTIENIVVIGTAVSFSILKCLKSSVDKELDGKFFNHGEELEYSIDNNGAHRLVFTIYIDGIWLP